MVHFSSNFVNPLYLLGIILVCQFAHALSLSSVEGIWALNTTRDSQSLKPFLLRCGVPRLVAPLLSKAFEKDNIHIGGNIKAGIISVELKRKGWNLPVNLQTDATYFHDNVVDVDTPRGQQSCRMLKSSNTKLIIEKKGPSSNEQVDEVYELIEKDVLLQILRHRNFDTINTEVKRYFHRVNE
mmetsp:Transcript_6062/g.9617  ORF Transcript_6062/g.9617 Transcript_6062/m.9617 type:complete len:183 (+) Transcript_6062:13-561(+)